MADERQASGASWERMLDHGERQYLGDPKVVAGLVRGFIHESFGHGHADLKQATAKLTAILSGQDPGYRALPGLAQHLHQALPQATEEAESDAEAIEQVVTLGALIARDLLKQAKNQDQAGSYLTLFIQDWTRLLMGLPMQREWTEKPKPQHNLFEEGKT